jgi:methyltransferase (TIGR00027 family)
MDAEEFQRASYTMVRSAVRRATHQLLDVPVVFNDPISVGLVEESSARAIHAAYDTYRGQLETLLRSLFVLRNRFAEDRLAEAAKRGVCQYVIVGAGLDTFPWRQPDFARGLRIFFADHPASLAWTQGRFRQRGLINPPNLTIVSLDLDRQGISERLIDCGFDPARPSFVAALGVLHYIEPLAIERLLGFSASLPSGSEIVVSFALPDDELSGQDLVIAIESVNRVAALGEPWKSRLRPREVAARLVQLGFKDVFHLTPVVAQERYFASRMDGLRAPGWEQLVAAVV